MLDMQQLRYFVAVAETENVGQAAKALHLTQSPLSRQIQGLELHLGLELFHRSKKRLRLTATGREFLAEAKALLSHGERVERRARSLSAGDTGTLVIGYIEGAIHADVLPRALRSFRKQVPSASIELRALRSNEQFLQLAAGDIDIGFSYSAPPADAALNARCVHRESFVLAFPTGVFVEGTRISPRKLSEQPFIAMPEARSPSARREFMVSCETAGFHPRIRYEAAEPLAVLGLVQAGLGVAVVQKSLQGKAPDGVSFAPMPGGFPMKLEIHVASERGCTPLATMFFDGVRPTASRP